MSPFLDINRGVIIFYKTCVIFIIIIIFFLVSFFKSLIFSFIYYNYIILKIILRFEVND